MQDMGDDSRERTSPESLVILPSTSVVLQPFIAKLGHNVEEIRVRALKNILVKLEHRLICVADLVQERDLLIRLLQWFNIPSAPLKKDVLGLLAKLSTHVSAAQVLLSLGTIEFMSQLRQDIEPELYKDVDNVIQQLLSLPQNIGDRHDDWCLYKGHGRQENWTDVKAVMGPVKNGGHFKSASCPAFSRTDKPQAVPSSQSIPQFGKPHGYFVDELERVPSQTSMGHSSMNTARSQDSAQVESSALTFFQWLPLSLSDRHILTATDSRLQSRSPTLVAKSCEFLSDVLFKDFPAEIFLQRPSVLRSLLDIMESQIDTTDASLALCAIHCLKELCCHVQYRLMETSDPALFCPDQECWKASERMPLILAPTTTSEGVVTSDPDKPQERVSGDGGLGSDAASPVSSQTDVASLSATDETEDELVIEALQYDQLAVEEACLMVLPRAIQVLTSSHSTNNKVILAAVELLFHVGELIKMVTPLDIWNEGSQANTVMAPAMVACLKSLGEATAFHMRQSGYHGNVSTVSPTLPTHRMAVINLTAFTLQLLQAVIPFEQAASVIPSELVTILSMVSLDGILARTHGHLHDIVLEYLTGLDDTSHQIYLHLNDICQSTYSTCNFLKATKTKASVHSTADLLSLLASALPSLAYHKHMGVVREGVKLCSQACCAKDADPGIVKTSRNVILTILAHYDNDIRLEGYKACMGVVTDALRISHVTYPMSIVCQGMLVVLEPTIVNQICAYGLYDQEEKIKDFSVNILENMLLGRLSMSTELWRRVLVSITPSLPILEAYMGTHNTMDQCVLDLVTLQGPNTGPMTADGEVVSLAPIEQLRGSLRLLLARDPQLRTKALEAVVWFLMTDQTHPWGQTFFKGRSSENLRDIFIVDPLTSMVNRSACVPRPAGDNHVAVPHPSVEKTEINKLWEIYSSRSVDWSIRKSAAEQLAIILQDPHWHPTLLELHADEVTLGLVKEILTKDGSTHTPTTPCPSMELVTPCLKIVRLLVEFSWSCRRRLARRVHVYTTIVMATVTCQPSTHASYEGACLMTLLLFDEVAGQEPIKALEIAFSLPGYLVKSYQLPFNPPVHTPTSQHQFPVPKEPDPVRSDLGVCLLRLAWNLAWHESLDKLCAVEGVADSVQDTCGYQYWEVLRWRALDSHILRCSYTKSCIADQIEALGRATSHYPVLTAITRVRSHLMTDLGTSNRDDTLAVRTLYSIHWQEALERYLQVLPNSLEDDELLTGVLRVLSDILTSPSPPPEPIVAWMVRVTIQNDGPLLSLLRTTQMPPAGGESESATDSRRALRKTLLALLSTLVKVVLQCTTTWRFDSERIFIGDLAHAVALNLDLADNPQYYDLPVLESALECLGHVTSRSRWSTFTRSTDPFVLCTTTLDSLVQVLSAFHAGRLGSRSSFMGKGVTFHASQCLTHLAREMQILDQNKSWASHWIRARDTSDQQPLNWLVTLWWDRSAEVRWMGLSIATSIATSEIGQGGLLQTLQEETGGVLSVALSILLNDGECGLVRQQSALLICNLMRQVGGNPGTENSTKASKNKSPPSSAQAIQALLDYYQFHDKLSTLLTSTSVATLRPYNMATSSRAVQSSASTSSSSSGVPYKPLASSSHSVSMTSVTPQNAMQSPVSESNNGVHSPGEQSTVTLSSGSMLSNSVSVMSTAQTQTPMSVIPLINERGLPSGMSTSSSNTRSSVPSAMGSMTSSANVGASSLTPGLLSALAHLVQSLVTVLPGDTLNALKRTKTIEGFYSHLDSTEIQTFLQDQQDSSAASSSQTCAAFVVVREVLHMYSSLVRMTHVLARVDHTLLYELQQDNSTMHKIVALLAIDLSYAGSHLQQHAYDLWLAVSQFLVTLLQTQGPVSVPSLAEDTLYKFWHFFTAIFTQVTSDNTSPPALRSSILRLLGLLLTADGKRCCARKRPHGKRYPPTPPRDRSVLVQLLDGRKGQQDVKECDEGRETSPNHKGCSDARSGSELCTSLMKAYDNISSRVIGDERQGKDCVRNVLTGLLAVSFAAKETALKDGLSETSLEQIKLLHVQMNMDSLLLGKGPTWKKKENPLVDELISSLDMLRNFIYQFNEGKAACIECGLIDVLHKLWAWCTVDASLRTTVLVLLSTLTARYPRAAATIAGGSSTSRASQSGTTLLNSLLKTAGSTNSRVLSSSSCPDLDTHLATHKALFTLLANLVLSPECRSILWKSNFLQQFTNLKPLKTLQSRPKHVTRTVGGAWLSLLVNLSFFNDGQSMLMKVPGCVGVLLEFCHVVQAKHSNNDVALLVLRNLCFHGNSKAVLLSNESLLAHLIKQVDHSADYVKALAVSALWSLVNNCQKARGSLKNAGLVKKLEELRMRSDLQPFSEEKYLQIYNKGLAVLQLNLI